MQYIFLKSFLKKFDAYASKEQQAVTQTVEEILHYLGSSTASYGLRIKKLSSKIYEARINIHLRILFYVDQGLVKFFALGNHDDIRRILKTLKDRDI